MQEGPAALNVARVPRSFIDELWVAGEPVPASRVITGIVVSLDGDTCTCLVAGDEEVPGIVWLGSRPPDVGDVVNIEMRGDLLVIPDEFVEGVEDDSVHIVSDTDPGSPQPEPVNIGGSMRDLTAWTITGTGWTRDLSAAGDGMRVWSSTGAAATATLWSTQPFECAPGDLLDFAAAFTRNTPTTPTGGDTTVQLVICWGVNENLDPNPGTDQVTAYGPVVTINGTAVPLTTTVTVPAALVAGTVPANALIGWKFTGPAAADVTANSTSLVHTPIAWPLGSLWLNPVPGQALPTVGSTDQTDTATSVVLTATGALVWTAMPSGFKALVTAPPDTSGVVLIFYTCALNAPSTQTTPRGMQVGILADGTIAPPVGRFACSVASASNQLPLFVSTWVRITAGSTMELKPAYCYSQAGVPTIDLYSIRGTAMTVVFIPTAVGVGDAAQPAPVSFWDGNSWRPGNLRPATMDMSKAATSTEPSKTATTTTITRSPSSVLIGEPITLTSTTTPSAATGTVTFQRATSTSGPWTAVGTVNRTAGTGSVTRTWTPTSGGTYYFRAVYSGDTTYATSTSAATSATTVTNPTHTADKTFNAQWVMPYNGGGSQKGGGSFAGDTYCGYFDSQTGNQKSMIQFLPNLPADADVTKVELICDNWDFWRTNKGGLVVGWHENKGGSAPNNWSNTHANQSEHSPGEGKFTVNITGWADTKVTRSDFGGITIGPGATNGDLYNGNCLGKGNWHLKVTYKTAT
jgi:Bacterial Ig-like domain (group 3)